MNKLTALAVGIILLLGLAYLAFAQETITLTTYYPAPYGVYRLLRLFPVDAAPEACSAANEGAIYFHSGTENKIMLCADTGSGFAWDTVASKLWEASGNNIYNTNTGNVEIRGNLGVGTAATQAKLTIANNLAGGALNNFSEYQLLLWRAGNAINSYGLGIRPSTLVFKTAADFNFDQGWSTVMTIQGGSVGIGTINPQAKLTVDDPTGNTTWNTAAFHKAALGPNWSHIHYGNTGDWYIRSAASSGKVILQDTGGNVGIGTQTPAQDAILDISFPTGNPGALLVPRMTRVQRNSLTAPVDGMIIYNTTARQFEFRENGNWVTFTAVPAP